MMNAPPKQLDQAAVLLYTRIDGRHRPTGACRHTVAGELMGQPRGLAICVYEQGDGFYLFYCDEEWAVVTDTWHATLEDAKAQAAFEYEGVDETWQEAAR